MSKFVTWKVAEAPTGPYRSFHRRGWPSACFKNAARESAAMIRCADAYRPERVRSGDHAELEVYVADWARSEIEARRNGAFVWRRLKKRAATLAEAKKLVDAFFEAHPEFVRK